jgi:hypothetical protein
MKISRARLKEIVKEVMVEETEYQQFFQKALDKAGKSIPDMSEEEKKAFFDKIDSAWNGKGEKNEELVGGQKELDVDSDGDIEGDDLADLRAGKKADESINELMTYSARSKETGKVVMFKDKAHRDAAIKRGTFTPSENTPKKKSSTSKGTGVNIFTKESVNEAEDINWGATENAIINFLKANTKILDKRVKDRDTDGVKKGLQSIIDGLTNAQRSLKLK